MAFVSDRSVTMAGVFSDEPSVVTDGLRKSLIDQTCC